MAVSKDLLLAILAMDAYNRGYKAGIEGLPSDANTQVGSAKIKDIDLPANAEAAGFYAISYTISGTFTDLDGKTVISYRGTDKNRPTLRESGSDLVNGYGLALGSYSSNQSSKGRLIPVFAQECTDHQVGKSLAPRAVGPHCHQINDLTRFCGMRSLTEFHSEFPRFPTPISR